jgi:hypothetical protein
VSRGYRAILLSRHPAAEFVLAGGPSFDRLRVVLCVTNEETPGTSGLVPEMTAMISQMANLRVALAVSICETAPSRRSSLAIPAAGTGPSGALSADELFPGMNRLFRWPHEQLRHA